MSSLHRRLFVILRRTFVLLRLLSSLSLFWYKYIFYFSVAVKLKNKYTSLSLYHHYVVFSSFYVYFSSFSVTALSRNVSCIVLYFISKITLSYISMLFFYFPTKDKTFVIQYMNISVHLPANEAEIHKLYSGSFRASWKYRKTSD